jgi:hypothetical protein
MRDLDEKMRRKKKKLNEYEEETEDFGLAPMHTKSHSRKKMVNFEDAIEADEQNPDVMQNVLEMRQARMIKFHEKLKEKEKKKKDELREEDKDKSDSDFSDNEKSDDETKKKDDNYEDEFLKNISLQRSYLVWNEEKIEVYCKLDVYILFSVEIERDN